MANFRKSITDVQGSAKAAAAILEGAEGAVEQVTRCCCSYLKPFTTYHFQHITLHQLGNAYLKPKVEMCPIVFQWRAGYNYSDPIWQTKQPFKGIPLF